MFFSSFNRKYIRLMKMDISVLSMEGYNMKTTSSHIYAKIIITTTFANQLDLVKQRVRTNNNTER